MDKLNKFMQIFIVKGDEMRESVGRKLSNNFHNLFFPFLAEISRKKINERIN